MIYLQPRLVYSGFRPLYLSFESEPEPARAAFDDVLIAAFGQALLNETACPMQLWMGSSTPLI